MLTLVPLAVAAGCQDATQVGLTLRTNAPHREGASVAVWAGTTATGAPVTQRTERWTGDPADLGSIVVTPRALSDEPLSIRVVLAVGRDPSTCSAADAVGCIVARRKLSFVPRTRLRVPVVLHLQCSGVFCDQDSTCNALGRCVPAAVDPTACAGEIGCSIPDDEPASPAPAPVEAGALDATGPLDASVDQVIADAGDAAPPADVCAPGVPLAGFARGVAFCGDASKAAQYSVCSAAALCNVAANWQQCTATQYRAAFATVAPPVADAAIRSCIRSGPAPMAPTDQACVGNCAANSPEAAPPIAWTCAGGVVTDASQNSGYVGLVSALQCSRAGIDDPSTSAYWRPHVAISFAQFIRHAACCKAN